MKNKNNILRIKALLMLCFSIVMFNACNKDDDQSVVEETRLFRPVLNEDLFSEGNTIIVNMGTLKRAVGYTLEVSRDTFASIDYTIQTDTSYVEINKAAVGEDLFWNTLYQVRATAHAENSEFDSKLSDLGNVRTQRFPTILNLPASYDVIDVAARVTWTPLGAPVTGMRVFAATDLKLSTPLFSETPVATEEQEVGESFVNGLDPETEYQIAIYSGEDIRGWVNYTTKIADIDPNGPGVIDIRDNESASAVEDAVISAPDGAIILVKRGITYDLPSTPLENKSITIRGAYGFGEQKARLYTTGNWNIASGSNIDHIRFIDLELRGADYSGDYIFNPSSGDTNVNEVLFENCKIGTFRGIMRLRGTNAVVNNYEIRNSIVDSIGGYGLFTTDTNPGDPQTATVNNIKLVNSTFNKLQFGFTSRNNSESILIESCTFANYNNLFRYRGGDGNNNVSNGIEIKNSIFGRSWDEADAGPPYTIRGVYEGLSDTTFDVGNTWATSDLTWADGGEIPGLPSFTSTSSQEELWLDTAVNDFNFKNSGFGGRFDAGDPRWRVKL